MIYSFRDLQNYTTLKRMVLCMCWGGVLEIYRITLLSNNADRATLADRVLEIYRITLLSNML